MVEEIQNKFLLEVDKYKAVEKGNSWNSFVFSGLT